jgi:hypothetical protein
MRYTVALREFGLFAAEPAFGFGDLHALRDDFAGGFYANRTSEHL